MDESIPVLPHLPAVETWRESTQSAALHRSPRLEELDDALATYEASFRRYSVTSQAYYLKLRSSHDEPNWSHQGPQARAAWEQAEALYSRAAHDFEAVEIAFNAWLDRGDTSRAEPVVQQLDASLSAGRSQLDARSPQAAPAPQGAGRSTGISTGPAKGLIRKLSLKPRR
jgi:hypothetical protein